MKTVIITGASGDIGAQTARVFAAAGYYVFALYKSGKSAAEMLCTQINSQAGRTCCQALYTDVTDENCVRSMAEQVLKKTGRIDVLINNAGISLSGLLTHTSLERWQQVMDVNVTGVFLCCKHILPHMISKKRGSIVNISSVWGMAGASCEACYSASKGAVIGLTKALAKEAGPSGIRVNCVAPGVIETKMLSGLNQEDMDSLKQQSALGIAGTPEDVAKACLFLASEDARFFTGQVLSPNGGMVI